MADGDQPRVTHRRRAARERLPAEPLQRGVRDRCRPSGTGHEDQDARHCSWSRGAPPGSPPRSGRRRAEPPRPPRKPRRTTTPGDRDADDITVDRRPRLRRQRAPHKLEHDQEHAGEHLAGRVRHGTPDENGRRRRLAEVPTQINGRLRSACPLTGWSSRSLCHRRRSPRTRRRAASQADHLRRCVGSGESRRGPAASRAAGPSA